MNDTKIETNGLLVELAYLKLENYTKSYNDIDALENYMTDRNEDKELIGGIDEGRQDKMLALLNDYEIVDFKSDDGMFASDFQGMLLKEKATGEYVIAFRGTDGKMDGAVDGGIANILLNHNFQLNEAKTFVNEMKEKCDLKANLAVL